MTTPQEKQDEVIKLFLELKDNRITTISELTGVKYHCVSDIINRYLFEKWKKD